MAVLTRAAADGRRDEMSLVDDNGSRTFGRTRRECQQADQQPPRRWNRRSDTIAIVAGNRIEWFELALACANTGITHVPINWHLVAPEIAYIIGDCGAKAVMVGHRFVDEVASALADAQSSEVELALIAGTDSVGRFQNFDDFMTGGSPEEPENQSFGGPMFYTSGTTGSPKGVKSSLSAMPPGTTPEIWHLIGAGFPTSWRCQGSRCCAVRCTTRRNGHSPFSR